MAYDRKSSEIHAKSVECQQKRTAVAPKNMEHERKSTVVDKKSTVLSTFFINNPYKKYQACQFF